MDSDIYYVGLLDDEVNRTPWTGHPRTDLDYINRTLVSYALFGKRMLINDGYLLLYEAGRRALMSREASPLIDLIDDGFVKFMSRTGGDLAALPAEGAKRGVATYVELQKTSEYDDLIRALRELQRRPGWAGAWMAAPRIDFGRGFLPLIRHVEGRPAYLIDPLGFLTADTLQRVFDRFNQLLREAPDKPPRTTWASVISDKTYVADVNARDALMRLANEAYHYNLAACLHAEASEGEAVGVATRFTTLFSHLQEVPSVDERGSSPDELPQPTNDIPFEVLHNSGVLREAVTPLTRLNNAKRAYLLAVDRATLDRKLIPEACAAAEAYNAYLKERVGGYLATEGGEVFKAIAAAAGVAGGFFTADAVTDHLIEARTGSALTLIGGLAGAFLTTIGAVHALRWWYTKRLSFFERALSDEKRADMAADRWYWRRIANLGATAAISISKKTAKEHASGLPRWN